MLSLLKSIKVVKDPRPERPPIREEERDQVADANRLRIAPPSYDLRACSSLAGWFEAYISEHRCRGQYSVDGELHELIVTALQDLVLSIRRIQAISVQDLLRRGGAPYRSIDLGLVAIPAAGRQTALAEILDEEASYYLDLGTELGRLAAWAILWHSEGIERIGAATLQAYYDADMGN